MAKQRLRGEQSEALRNSKYQRNAKALLPLTTRLPSWRSHALPTSCWSSVSLKLASFPTIVGQHLLFPRAVSAAVSQVALSLFCSHLSVFRFPFSVFNSPSALLLCCRPTTKCLTAQRSTFNPSNPSHPSNSPNNSHRQLCCRPTSCVSNCPTICTRAAGSLALSLFCSHLSHL